MNERFGIYRGVVTNNNDPEGLLRVRAIVPQILGEAECDWAWPVFPPGWTSGLLVNHSNVGGNPVSAHQLVASTPPPGAGVWIMFEAGDVSRPCWCGTWKKN